MLRAKYRKTAVVGTAAAVLFVSGCSTLPNNTGPQVVGTYQQQPEGPEEVIAPQPGDDPDLTLRDFYQASAVPGNDHEVARRLDSWSSCLLYTSDAADDQSTV